MKSNRVKRWGTILIFFGFAFGIPGFWLCIAPDHYQATARIEINPKPDLRFYDLHSLQTKLEVMRSEFALSNVVTKLNLATEWGKRYAKGGKLELPKAIALLNRSLHLSPIRNTTFIDISVITEDFIESEKIADSVTEAYCDWRTWSLQEVNIAKVLEEELEMHDQNIKAAQTEVDRLKIKLNPPDVIPNEPDSKLQPYLEAKQKLQQWKNYHRITEMKLNSSWRPPSPVSIVHRAIAEATPIAPRRALGIILLDLSAILIVSGVVLALRNWRKEVLSFTVR